LTVRVSDTGTSNNVTVRTFDVTIQPVNDAPTIAGIADQAISEDGLLDVQITVGDIDNVATALTLEATSFNEELISASSFSFSGSGNNRTLRLQPLPDQSGAATIFVTVRDPSGA